MYSHFSDLLRLLKNGHKSDSFAPHFKQHFHSTVSRTYLRKYMMFKVLKHIKPIGAMKKFTKPNCNLCIEERIPIIKKLHDKRVTIMKKNSYIYEAYQHKTSFRRFCLSTDDLVFNG